MGDAQPAQLEHVAEAGGGDERGDAASALEHRVGGDGRPVDDLGQVAVGGRELRDGRHHRVVVARRGGEELPDRGAAVVLAEHDVGEGAADVDPDPRAHIRSRLEV